MEIKMMTPLECKEAWQAVVKLYNETIEGNNPKVTMRKIVRELTFEKTKEIFAVVSALKKHDGRIYGRNREYMQSIPFNPACAEWVAENPIRYAGLDDIHTAHIDNLISQLRALENDRKKAKTKLEKYAKENGYHVKIYAVNKRRVGFLAKVTDNTVTFWINYLPTDMLDEEVSQSTVWFYDPRPDTSPEKSKEFATELSNVLETPFDVRQMHELGEVERAELKEIYNEYMEVRNES